MYRNIFLLFMPLLFVVFACEKKAGDTASVSATNSGLKIAYVNGDSILMNFKEFRAESEAMEIKQRQAEDDLQKKGAALEREFLSYQQQAQQGTLTGKQMQERERYLSGKQEDLLAERDRAAKAIMEETSKINDRLQKVLQDKLKEIKEKEGYDFILSYVAGGPILIADEKHDITEMVLEELNKTTSGDTLKTDTLK